MHLTSPLIPFGKLFTLFCTEGETMTKRAIERQKWAHRKDNIVHQVLAFCKVNAGEVVCECIGVKV